MDRVSLIACLATLICAPVLAADLPATAPADGPLRTLKDAHPRLLLTEERLAELKEQAKSDLLLDKIIKDVVASANRMLGQNAAARGARSGGRVFPVLAAAYRLTGDEKYAKKAVEGMVAMCELEDWNPGHFLDPSEASMGMAVGYDWLYDAMDQPTRDKVRQGIVDKGLKEGLKAYTYDPPDAGWWTRRTHNWNTVCNGGMVVAALAVAESEPELARTIVAKALKSLPYALATYDSDGAWMEGPGYWQFATTYAVYMFAAMRTALGTDFGLSDRQGLAQTGWYGICEVGPTGLLFNYADCSPSRFDSLPFMYWLAQRYDQPAFAAWQADRLKSASGSVGDLIYYTPAPDLSTKDWPLDRLFQGTMDIMFMRSSWDDPEALYLGIKGGYNQSAHPNLDLGTFVLDALGQRWACDLGSESYSLPDYFVTGPRGKRWDYFRCNSHGHNVPLLDDMDQLPMGIAGVTEHKLAADGSFIVLDLTGGYARLADSVQRGAAIIDGRRAILIQDEFLLVKPCDVAWGITTQADVATDGATAVMTLGGKQMRVTAIEPGGAIFAVESAEQAPPQKANEGYRRLVLRTKADAGDYRVAVLFSPVWADGKQTPTPEIVPLASWR
jgi:hypothetical protein